MKKNMSKFISIILSVLLIFSSVPLTVFASSQTVSEDGMFAYEEIYTDEKTDKTFVEITGYLGEEESVTVPAEIDGFDVLGLSYTFSESDFVNEVVISEGIMYIGEGAFYGNYDLSVTLPESLKYIGEGAFGECIIDEISFSEGLLGISASAFNICAFNCAVNLPDSLKYFGHGVFYGCTVPSLYIGENACPSMEVTFDYSGEVTGGGAYFYDEYYWSPFIEQYSQCDVRISDKNRHIKLYQNSIYTYDSKYILSYLGIPEEDAEPVDIDILDGTKLINQYVFPEGLNIGTLKISASVESISDYAFVGMYIGKLEFAENSRLKNIGDFAFTECLPEGALVIPSSVEKIGKYAFANNYIDSIEFELPSSCTVIGSNAFDSCYAVESIIFPKSIETIGTGAFNNCESLSSVVFEDNSKLTSLGAMAFSNTDISHFDTGKNNSVTRISCFDSSLKLEVLDLSNCPNLELLSSMEFLGNQYLKEVNLSNTIVKNIPKDCFNGCSNLERVILPDTVMTISDYAFASCPSLTSINVDNVVNIGASAFKNAGVDIPARTVKTYNDFKYIELPTGIAITEYTGSSKEVVIPDSIDGVAVIKINNNVFRGKKIDSVTLPAGLRTIGSYAFYDSSLKQMPVLPETLETIGDYAFSDVNVSGELVIPDSVVSIGAAAFRYCKFDSIKLGNSVSYIGGYAFYDCRMESLVIPASVTYLDERFTDGAVLKSIDFGSSTANIENILKSNNEYFLALEEIKVSANNSNYSTLDGVLYSKDMSCLISYPKSKPAQTFTVPDGVNTIKSYAFVLAGINEKLEKLIIGDSVKVLEEYALMYTYSVKEIYISGNVESIGYYAMGASVALETVTFGEGLHISALDAVFSDCEMLETVTFAADSTVETMNVTFAGSGIKNAYLPDNVKSFNQTFYATPRLEAVRMPANLEYISDEAFFQSGIKSIEIPSLVTSIQKATFKDCDNLSSVNFNNVKGISEHAFDNCTALRSVDLSGVTYVDETAFSGCSNLKKLYFIKESDENEIAESSFRGNEDVETIVVGGSVTKIDDYAFADCQNLENAFISDSVTEISDNAFENCVNLNIICLKNSYAHQYAAKNAIPCQTLVVDPIADQEYTGKALTPAVTVRAGDSTLALNKDFETSYADNINVGRARVTVLGLGDYCVFGTVARFNIVKTEPENPKSDSSSESNSNTNSNSGTGNSAANSDATASQQSAADNSNNGNASSATDENKSNNKKTSSQKTDKKNSEKASSAQKKSNNKSNASAVQTAPAAGAQAAAQNHSADTVESVQNDTNKNSTQIQGDMKDMEQNKAAEPDEKTAEENKSGRKSSSKKLTLWQRIVRFFKTIFNWFVSLFK